MAELGVQARVLFLTSQFERLSMNTHHAAKIQFGEKPVSRFDVKLFQYNAL